MKKKVIAALLSLTLLAGFYPSIVTKATAIPNKNDKNQILFWNCSKINDAGAVNPFAKQDSTIKLAAKSSVQSVKNAKTVSTNMNSAEVVQSTDNAKGHYNVKFKDSVSLSEIYACVSHYSYKMLSESKDRLFRIDTDNLTEFQNTYKDILENVSKDYALRALAVPDDAYYSYQWAISALNLPKAWDVTKGASSVKVAVIDTGFARGSADFNADSVLAGYDLTKDTANVTTDTQGHGTAVASVIGAATNNSTGMSGGCWSVTIVPYKVANSEGDMYDSSIIEAIQMAANAGCDVLNMSLGEYSYDETVQDAIDYAVKKGCIVVAAAGNEGDAGNVYKGKKCYPASYNGVISVAAVNSNNQRAYFSQYNDAVDVSAPGQRILVTDPEDSDYYVYENGTSFSSPYVAAVAALARSENKSITSDGFLRLIKQTSTCLGTLSYDNYYGWGLINAKAIVDAAVIPVTSISLKKTGLTIAVDGSAALTATVLPKNASNKAVTWSSSDTGVATVDANGTVTGVSVGKTTICAATKSGNIAAFCTVNVVNRATGVTLNKTTDKLIQGVTDKLTATVNPIDATMHSVVWSSSNSSIVSVDKTGRITAKKAGKATVKAAAQDGLGAAAYCVVTVVAKARKS